jgi:hypothetical protein
MGSISFTSRLRYRGLTLLMFGLMFVVLGIAVVVNPMFDPNLFHTWLPMWFRVTVWSGAGLVAIVAAWFKQWEFLGFAALFIGPFERFISFTTAMIFVPSPLRLTGSALYLLLSLAILLFAAWPEPSERLEPR